MASLPLCQYGAKCYQTSAQHLAKYSHPKPSCKYGDKCTDTTAAHKTRFSHAGSAPAEEEAEEIDDDEEVEEPISVAPSSSGKSPCSFGEYCYRTEKAHRRDFEHPKKSAILLP